MIFQKVIQWGQKSNVLNLNSITWSIYIIIWVSPANFKIDIWPSEWIGHCAWLKIKILIRDMEKRWSWWRPPVIQMPGPFGVVGLISSEKSALHFCTVYSSHYKVNKSSSSVWSVTLWLSLPCNCLIWLPLPHFLAACSPLSLSVWLYSRNVNAQNTCHSQLELTQCFIECFGLSVPCTDTQHRLVGRAPMDWGAF